MRKPARASLVFATLALSGVLLTACAAPSAPAARETTTPSPSPSPIFTSDAQALAAATAAFKRFEATNDAVGRAGWTDMSPLKPLISAGGYSRISQTAAQYREKHAHATGHTVINNTVFESHSEAGRRATIRMYVCEDLRGVDVVDQSGKSLNDSSRSDFVSFETQLAGSSGDSLVIESLGYWSGGGICK